VQALPSVWMAAAEGSLFPQAGKTPHGAGGPGPSGAKDRDSGKSPSAPDPQRRT
jgi:hypothetical protein